MGVGSSSDFQCHLEEGESPGRKEAVPYLFKGLSLESHLGPGSTAGHLDMHGMGLGYGSCNYVGSILRI